eukprot:m.36858 g.36858  ORF g.36858 m.36858 type:complete len:87 (+) comp9193_c1_seq1:158-418(+)
MASRIQQYRAALRAIKKLPPKTQSKMKFNVRLAFDASYYLKNTYKNGETTEDVERAIATLHSIADHAPSTGLFRDNWKPRSQSTKD